MLPPVPDASFVVQRPIQASPGARLAQGLLDSLLGIDLNTFFSFQSVLVKRQAGRRVCEEATVKGYFIWPVAMLATNNRYTPLKI